MKKISTKAHGFLDYISGLLFIASPWFFGFANGGAAQIVPVMVGIIVLVISLFTNYEAGIIKRLHMRVHLTMDILAGVLLIVSPWLFGFAEVVYLPHIIFGIFSIAAGLMTSTTPSTHVSQVYR